jgi:hypothetical protein
MKKRNKLPDNQIAFYESKDGAVQDSQEPFLRKILAKEFSRKTPLLCRTVIRLIVNKINNNV